MKSIRPVIALVLALAVLFCAVAWLALTSATTASHEHVDHAQIVRIETYLNEQIAKSKGCSAEPHNATLKTKCEQTVDGFIDSLDPVERRALADAIEPYLPH